MIQFAGGILKAVPLLEESNFSFDLDAFDRLVNKRTKLIILNSPSNPTGGVIPMPIWSTLRRRHRNLIAGLCRMRFMRAWLMMD